MFMVIALIFLLMHFALLESPQRNLILSYKCTVWATMCMPCSAWIECLRYPYTLPTFPLSNLSSMENSILWKTVYYGKPNSIWYAPFMLGCLLFCKNPFATINIHHNPFILKSATHNLRDLLMLCII